MCVDVHDGGLVAPPSAASVVPDTDVRSSPPLHPEKVKDMLKRTLTLSNTHTHRGNVLEKTMSSTQAPTFYNTDGGPLLALLPGNMATVVKDNTHTHRFHLMTAVFHKHFVSCLLSLTHTGMMQSPDIPAARH